MRNATTDLYDPLAPYYHLLFEDWDASIARQGAMLHSLLTLWLGAAPVRILDCACGIGTQAIGLHATATGWWVRTSSRQP